MTTDNIQFEVSAAVKALVPEYKLKSMLETFTQVDSNHDGKIDLEEFLAVALSKEETRIKKTFEAVDTDKDGFVEFEEFVAVAEPTFCILKRFRELDLDHNGLLSVQEAISIADRLVLPVSSQQVKDVIAQVDHDGDGQVTYFEFLGAIAHIGFQ